MPCIDSTSRCGSPRRSCGQAWSWLERQGYVVVDHGQRGGNWKVITPAGWEIARAPDVAATLHRVQAAAQLGIELHPRLQAAGVDTTFRAGDTDSAIRDALADQDGADALLLRGFDTHHDLPSFADRYRLRAATVAIYPMYRGVAKLCGMDTLPKPSGLDGQVESLREHWDDYQAAYEEAIRRTATPDTPWIVVPADKKWHRDLVICRALVDALEGLDLRYPEPEEDLSGIVVE